ncbi:MAG TPA: Arm DNA-binding domain-containing protein [Sphingobium sp.]
MPLTLMDVKNAKPALKSYKMTDAKGLYLVVSPAGGKTWRLKYRFGFKEKLLTLGRFPELSLVSARTAAEDARRLVLSSKDPVLEAQKEKAVRLAASEATFRKMGEEWFEDNRDGWSPSNASRVHHRLERDL